MEGAGVAASAYAAWGYDASEGSVYSVEPMAGTPVALGEGWSVGGAGWVPYDSAGWYASVVAAGAGASSDYVSAE